jgi:hypothetical protein
MQIEIHRLKNKFSKTQGLKKCLTLSFKIFSIAFCLRLAQSIDGASIPVTPQFPNKIGKNRHPCMKNLSLSLSLQLDDENIGSLSTINEHIFHRNMNISKAS